MVSLVGLSVSLSLSYFCTDCAISGPIPSPGMRVTVRMSELSPRRTVLEMAEEGWRKRPNIVKSNTNQDVKEM